MTELVAVRLDEEMVKRIDALRPNFSTEWHVATRTDIVRGLIVSRLDALDENPALLRQMWDSGGSMGPSDEAIQAWVERKKVKTSSK